VSIYNRPEGQDYAHFDRRNESDPLSPTDPADAVFKEPLRSELHQPVSQETLSIHGVSSLLRGTSYFSPSTHLDIYKYIGSIICNLTVYGKVHFPILSELAPI
ncbi:hypothetical protein, partial [Peribacillus sp. NPDC056705]|uniref:hypothetical protein n=1 Tax=Peribacillus sp. NPDC056705 TaxID=3345918 RepID=UPI003748E03D